MLRYFVAIVGGYAAMAIIVMAGFSIAYFNRDIAMHPGTLDVKQGWIIYTLILSLVAAGFGGWVCLKIAKCHKVVLIFAVLTLIIGVGMAIQNSKKAAPNLTSEQIASMSMPELGEHARQPDWYAFTLPFVGGIGILLGGRASIRC